MYFGFGGSSFAMHTEDQYLNSVSYLIRGANKAWFVVPPEYAEPLERWFVEDYRKCQHHLRHKCTITEPDLLREALIPVLEIEHCEGEFVITFARAPHWGHNRGRNQAEALNFGTEGWIPFGLSYQKGKCSLINDCGVEVPFIPVDNIAKKCDPILFKKYRANKNKITNGELLSGEQLPTKEELKQLSDVHSLGLVFDDEPYIY